MSANFEITGADSRSVKVYPTEWEGVKDKSPVTISVQQPERNYEAYLTCDQATALGKILLTIASLLERE